MAKLIEPPNDIKIPEGERGERIKAALKLEGSLRDLANTLEQAARD